LSRALSLKIDKRTKATIKSRIFKINPLLVTATMDLGITSMSMVFSAVISATEAGVIKTSMGVPDIEAIT
jgi:hypothetical protein